MRSKLLFLHADAPPTGGGTPVLVHRLLSGLGDDELITFADLKLRDEVRAGRGRVLPGTYHYVARKGLRGNRWRLGQVANGLLNIGLAVAAGVRAGRVARRAHVRWVLTVADDGFSAIGAAIAARIAGVPRLVMVFDLWEENAYTPFQRGLARHLERPLLRSAAVVIVHCREMQEHYRTKHGIDAIVLPTPVDLWSTGKRPPPVDDEREVVYGGAVYWAQEDAVRRLSAARHLVDGLRFTVIGSWAKPAELAARGIDVDQCVGELSEDAYRRRLAQSDVLFVGLSLQSDHADVIRTAAPAKLVEYMVAGRPIVVHAPRGSHVAEYARENGFALVVDEPDENALAQALRAALSGGPMVEQRAARGRELAAARHATDVVRRRFREILEAAA